MFGRAQTNEEVHRLVAEAIRERRSVAAVYEGARRLISPHILGQNQRGQMRVFCYQHGGESRSQSELGIGAWRCLSVSKMSSVELAEESWQTAPHGQQRCVARVEVDFERREPQNGQ